MSAERSRSTDRHLGPPCPACQRMASYRMHHHAHSVLLRSIWYTRDTRDRARARAGAPRLFDHARARIDTRVINTYAYRRVLDLVHIDRTYMRPR